MYKSYDRFHPFVYLLYFIFVLTVIMLYQHPFFLLFSSISLVLLNIVIDQGKQLKKWLPMIIFITSLFFILTPLINHRGNYILFYLKNPITLEAIIQGVILSLTLFSIMVLFVAFNMIITADKFLFLFSKWFPKWALLIMLSMRFVPLLKRRLQEIIAVQKSRGLFLRDIPVKRRLKNGLLFLQILLTWSLEDGIQTADSMSARGYGIQKRSKYTPYQFYFTDLFTIIILTLFVIIAVFGWWLGDGVLSILPILEPILLEGREWFYFAIFLLLISFPLISEGGETLLWRYWKRKI
ncbi:energy-coupling factor transporter transmembrane component T [Bacillus kwashiorkori]|uniref:energy-coupling factor transporter transmembrane component T n=1 Tax=Bacillus kwashiorkori TaxID=1522318 RepID=UPI000783A0AC|nr:energy-coupling factor transporter transmembrane component T [Bacillus kwashiorkori]